MRRDIVDEHRVLTSLHASTEDFDPHTGGGDNLGEALAGMPTDHVAELAAVLGRGHHQRAGAILDNWARTYWLKQAERRALMDMTWRGTA